MRVLIVTSIFPPDLGGPATYVPGLCDALRRKGHQITVLTSSEPEDLDRNVDQYPYAVLRANRRDPVLLRTLKLIWRIFRLGLANDVIYANGFFLEAALASRLNRRPLVIKKVGDEAWERATRRGWTSLGFESFQNSKPLNVQARLLKLLRNWSVGRARQVIVPSKYLARWARLWHVRTDRIQVVYNAVRRPDNAPRIHLALPTSLKVVTVGRLVAWKHHAELIRAVAESSHLSLVVVGDGPEFKRLQALSEASQASGRILLLGHKSRSEVWGILSDCDIFVLNSSYEGLPHVLLEAMSLAMPIIATRVGGIPEIVEDGKDGILIAPGSYGSLWKALARLADSSDLRKALGRRAQGKAALFRFDRMAEQTEQILQDALA